MSITFNVNVDTRKSVQGMQHHRSGASEANRRSEMGRSIFNDTKPDFGPRAGHRHDHGDRNISSRFKESALEAPPKHKNGGLIGGLIGYIVAGPLGALAGVFIGKGSDKAIDKKAMAHHNQIYQSHKSYNA